MKKFLIQHFKRFGFQLIGVSMILVSEINPGRCQIQESESVKSHNPAVLKLIYTINPSASESSLLDIILIPASGDSVAQRTQINPKEFTRLLSQFYSEVSSLRLLKTSNASSPSRRLYDILIGPLHEEIRNRNITTLLISANTGLQAVPFAALHDGKEWFGTQYSYSLTPSLSLMKQSQNASTGMTRGLLAGASQFDELAPLPMVPQEISQIGKIKAGKTYINENFTQDVLRSLSQKKDIDFVHLATHAEFLPGGPKKSKIYLGDGALSLNEFSQLRLSREENPIELFTLSACRTALGDRDSELGLAGLALQSGAKSAIGSLWYVDDIATSIYFIRFYRLLDRGLPKGEAMRQVRAEFANNQIELRGQSVYDRDGEILIDNLTPNQQRKLKSRFDHPFFWAAHIMLGLPW
jgi:CHAT domain-containing protein